MSRFLQNVSKAKATEEFAKRMRLMKRVDNAILRAFEILPEAIKLKEHQWMTVRLAFRETLPAEIASEFTTLVEENAELRTKIVKLETIIKAKERIDAKEASVSKCTGKADDSLRE